MTSDIVEGLRYAGDHAGEMDASTWYERCHDAADEITDMRQTLDEMQTEIDALREREESSAEEIERLRKLLADTGEMLRKITAGESYLEPQKLRAQWERIEEGLAPPEDGQ